jgi:hypothetical protein
LPHSDPYAASNWIGPSRKDDLNKKLTKIEGHQLPLGKHELLLNSIPGIKEDTIESYFLFRGQFFWNEKIECGFLNREPLHYLFKRELKETQRRYTVLNRPDWLGSIDRNEKILEQKISNTIDSDKPQMVKFDSKKVSFIVPDNWDD